VPNPTEWPVISDDPRVQKPYEDMRARGQSHRMAEMLAFRRPSGTSQTDKAFMQGCQNGEFLGELTPRQRSKYQVLARQAGVSIEGKTYKGSQARFEGDPRAWVSDVDECRKLVQVRNDERARKADLPPVRLAEDIVQEFVSQELAQTPLADPRELREKVIEQHGAPAC